MTVNKGSHSTSSRQQKEFAEEEKQSQVVKSSSEKNEASEKSPKEKIQESMDKIKEVVRAQEMIHVNIGYITSLFSASSNHLKIPVGQMMASIIPAIKNKQFKIFFQGAQPIGFVSWAFLSDEVANKHKKGNYFLKMEDWNSGNQAWVVDWIVLHPKLHSEQIVKMLLEKVFEQKDVYVLSRGENGEVKEVVKNFNISA